MNFTNLDDYSELRPLMIFARNARRRQVTERSERTVEEAEFHRNWQGDDVRPFFQME